MTRVLSLELTTHFAGAQVPNLDSTIVTSADKAPAERIEGQRSNKILVTGERTDAFTSGCIPDFDLLVIGTRHYDIVLNKAMF